VDNTPARQPSDRPLLNAISRPDHRPVLGIALKLASIVLFVAMALCVKLLGREIPTGQIIFVRGVISTLVLATIAWRTDQLHLLKTQNWLSHALRRWRERSVFSVSIRRSR
jgi:drug/metabolite transporter (DMT)-like permease